jgi:hypothetical protein
VQRDLNAFSRSCAVWPHDFGVLAHRSRELYGWFAPCSGRVATRDDVALHRSTCDRATRCRCRQVNTSNWDRQWQYEASKVTSTVSISKTPRKQLHSRTTLAALCISGSTATASLSLFMLWLRFQIL